jgi:RNA polymerase sigma-70 factor (ECF subfamily)
MASKPSSAQADELYSRCAAEFGSAMERLAAAYEADSGLRQDLLQEIHAALWRSLHRFDNRCSLRTWVYRVAHNTAASYVRSAIRHDWVSLEEAQGLSCSHDSCSHDPDRELVLERLMALIHQLRPLDRQVILLYLEDQDAASIAEITGLSAVNVATKIHRMKNILTRRFHQGERIHATPRTPGRVAVAAIANEPTDRRAPAPEGAPV